MNNLTTEEMEERIRIAGDIVRSEPPADPVEKAEWIDNLLTVADELDYVADMREAEPKDWADLSYPERLRKIATQARNCAESFETPTEDRSLENIFYPSGGG